MNEYELRHNPNPIVWMIDRGEPFQITKDGKPVAVCLPIDEYERLVGLATLQAIR